VKSLIHSVNGEKKQTDKKQQINVNSKNTTEQLPWAEFHIFVKNVIQLGNPYAANLLSDLIMR